MLELKTSKFCLIIFPDNIYESLSFKTLSTISFLWLENCNLWKGTADSGQTINLELSLTASREFIIKFSKLSYLRLIFLYIYQIINII